MPPIGFFSKNFLIGEFIPYGSSSSILVLESSMKTVLTPWSGSSSIFDIYPERKFYIWIVYGNNLAVR